MAKGISVCNCLEATSIATIPATILKYTTRHFTKHVHNININTTSIVALLYNDNLDK